MAHATSIHLWMMMTGFLLGILTLPGNVVAAEDLVLVKNGVPQCVIIAADGLSPSEKTGILELQKYLKEISGASIEVKNPMEVKSASSQTLLVYGNKTAREMHPDVKLDDLGKEGFVLKTVGNSLVVAGGEVRGSLYAAYELLERIGVRWWGVGETHVPKLATIRLAALDERQIPTIEYRDPLYALLYISEQDQKVTFSVKNKRNGFSYDNVSPEYGGRFWYHLNLVHSHDGLMQPVGNLDGRFETHPEYWAQRGGKPNKGQVCPSRPEVYEIMKANILKQLKDNPHYEFVVVGQNDNKAFCQCETCMALAKQEEAQGAATLLLANKLGEMLEKEHPGKFIMAPAYEWTRTPPKNLKPHRNVGIVLCTIECDFNRPIEEMSTPMNKKFAEDLIKWGSLSSKIYIWDYVTDFDHYLLPFPNLDALIPNIKFFVRHGVRGILEQGSHKGHGADFAVLRNWVLNRALWKPDQPDNGQALIAEFVHGYYGPAGPAIQKYIAAIHAPGRANPAMNAGCYARLDAQWLLPEAIANAEAALQEAEKAVANDPVFLGRVRLAHVPIWYVLFKRGPQSKTWAATEAKVGKLDPVTMAEHFRNVAKERFIQQVCDGEEIKGFLGWIKDYAALIAKGGAPLPPELKDMDPKQYRLIQACQMDSRGRFWAPQAEASDGWACEVLVPSWTINHQFSAFDDATPGKKYKVFIRVKSSAPKPEGIAVEAGIFKGAGYSSDWLETKTVMPTKQFPASVLMDGQFHALEVGEFTNEPTSGWHSGRLWVAKPSPTGPMVYLDCIWLQEVSP